MGQDPFESIPHSRITGPTVTFVVTPSDTEFDKYPKALWVGVAGDLVIVDFEDNQRTLKNVVAGVWHPITCKKVLAATTATDIVGGY